MRLIDLAHRWTGGLIGLLLAALGLSGMLLLYKDAWLRATVPHAADAQIQDAASVATAIGRLFANPAARPGSILLASSDNGLHRVSYERGVGAYADQAGNVVLGWTSQWERPEIWLFDLHHNLLAGKTGATIAGILALIGLGFILTGLILWWRTRRTFALRLWPKRLTRSAILRHHRDLGALLAPLLFLSMLTGVMLTLRPVANLLLSPLSSPAEMEAANRAPKARGGMLAADPDWRAILETARARYPTAELRVISLPKKPGELISIRMRQPEEWLPNGRTTLWFDPADGRLVEARDALRAPSGARAFSLVYPLHAAKVGGTAYKIVMTATGLGLTLLGTLVVFSFWRGRRRTPIPMPAPAAS